MGQLVTKIGVGQPTFKFYMKQHEMYIYQKILELKCTCAAYSTCLNTTPSLTPAIDSSCPPKSAKIHHNPAPLASSVDKNHHFLHITSRLRFWDFFDEEIHGHQSDIFHGG
jgi:hypothetical protein